MRMTVSRWGNSPGVRLPTVFIKQAGIEIGQEVNVEIKGRKLIIEPIDEISLDELLAKVTPQNKHDETDFGGPVGKEQF